MKYCFTISRGSSLEVFSYNGDDDKFIPTSLTSVAVEGLKIVVWSAQGLRLICLIRKNLYVHNHDFHTIVDTMRFPIAGDVVDISCSPGKNYLVLACNIRDNKDGKLRKLSKFHRLKSEIREVKIIEMKSGEVKGSFCNPGRIYKLIRWEESANDQYFALADLGDGTLSMYDNFEQIGAPLKRPFKKFAWSPTGLRLIIFSNSAHESDGPGLVRLFEIPSRNIVFEMPLIGVINIVMFHWQSKGEYVAILYTGVDYSECSQLNWIVYNVKTNITYSGSFEEKRYFIDFKWEPNGSRFAYSYMPHDKSCAVVEFYKLESVEGNNHPRWSNFTFVKSFGFPSKSTLFWSPAGRYIVLKYNQKLGFVDVAVNSHEILAIVNFNSDLVAWDPSGRFVHTLCDCEGEIKTLIWSFRGEPVYEFSAGKTLNWCGVFPVAENNDDDVEADLLKIESLKLAYDL